MLAMTAKSAGVNLLDSPHEELVAAEEQRGVVAQAHLL